MSEDKGYNGWTNYETWNMSLWIDNDPGEQAWWEENTYEVLIRNWNDFNPPFESFTHRDVCVQELSEHLKSIMSDKSIEVLIENEVSSMWADMIQASLDRVNYREIVEHWYDNLLDEAKIKFREQHGIALVGEDSEA